MSWANQHENIVDQQGMESIMYTRSSSNFTAISMADLCCFNPSQTNGILHKSTYNNIAYPT